MDIENSKFPSSSKNLDDRTFTRSPLKDFTNTRARLEESGGVSNKSSGTSPGGNEEDLKKAAPLESADKLSQSSLPSTPTRSVADTDTTTDYESADEGQAGLDITQLSRDLEKIHLSTPKSFSSSIPPEGRLLKFPSSPLENTVYLSSPESTELNSTWATVVDKTQYKSIYLNSTTLNDFVSEQEKDRLIGLSPNKDFETIELGESDATDVESIPVGFSFVSDTSPKSIASHNSDEISKTPNDANFKFECEHLNKVDISLDSEPKKSPIYDETVNTNLSSASVSSPSLQISVHEPDLTTTTSTVDVELYSQQPNSINISLNKTELEGLDNDKEQTCLGDEFVYINLPNVKDSPVISNISNNEFEINAKTSDISRRIDISGGIAEAYASDLAENEQITSEHLEEDFVEALQIADDADVKINLSDDTADLSKTESVESASTPERFSLKQDQLVQSDILNSSTESDKPISNEINVSENSFNKNTFVSDNVQEIRKLQVSFDSKESSTEQTATQINKFESETIVAEVTSQEKHFSCNSVEENKSEHVINIPFLENKRENNSFCQDILNSEKDQQNALTFNIDNQGILINQNFSVTVSEEKLNLDKNSEIFDLKQQNEFISTESSAVGAPLSSDTVVEDVCSLNSNVSKKDDVSFVSGVSFDKQSLSPIIKTEYNENLLNNDQNSSYLSAIDVDENETKIDENISKNLRDEFSPLNVSSASEKELQENIETCTALLLEEISDRDKSSVEDTTAASSTSLYDLNSKIETSGVKFRKSLNNTGTEELNEDNFDSYSEKLEPLTDVINKSIPELLNVSKPKSPTDEVKSSPIHVLNASENSVEKNKELQGIDIIEEDTFDSFRQIQTETDLLEKNNGNSEQVLEKDIKIGRTTVHSNLDFLLKSDSELEINTEKSGFSTKENELLLHHKEDENISTTNIRNEDKVITVGQSILTSQTVPLEVKEKIEEIIRDATDIVLAKKTSLLSNEAEISDSCISSEVKHDQVINGSLSKLTDPLQSNVFPDDESDSCKVSRTSLSSCDSNNIEEVKIQDLVDSSSSASIVESVICIDAVESCVDRSTSFLNNKIEQNIEIPYSTSHVTHLETVACEADKDLEKDIKKDDELSVNFENLNIAEEIGITERAKEITKNNLSSVINSVEPDRHDDDKQISPESFSGDILEGEELSKEKQKDSSLLNIPDIVEEGIVKKDLFNCSLSSVASFNKSSPFSPFHDSSFLLNTSLNKESVKEQLNRSYRDLSELIAICSKQERELAEKEDFLEQSHLCPLKEDVSLITKQELELDDKVNKTNEKSQQTNHEFIVSKTESEINDCKESSYQEKAVSKLERETDNNKPVEIPEKVQATSYCEKAAIVSKPEFEEGDNEPVVTSEKFQESSNLEEAAIDSKPEFEIVISKTVNIPEKLLDSSDHEKAIISPERESVVNNSVKRPETSDVEDAVISTVEPEIDSDVEDAVISTVEPEIDVTKTVKTPEILLETSNCEEDIVVSKSQRDIDDIGIVKKPKELLKSLNQEEAIVVSKSQLEEVEDCKTVKIEEFQECFKEEPPLDQKPECEVPENGIWKKYDEFQEGITQMDEVASDEEHEINIRKTIKTPEKFQDNFQEETTVVSKSERELGESKVSEPPEESQKLIKEEGVTESKQEREFQKKIVLETPKKFQETIKKVSIPEQQHKLNDVAKKTPEKFPETSKKEATEKPNKDNQTAEKFQVSFKEKTVIFSEKEEPEITEKQIFVTPEKFQVNFREEASIISDTIMAEEFVEQDTLNQHMMQPPPSADINNSEAGPITADEDFHKGEFFQEAAEVDFNLTPARLAPSLTRQSLYIRFDPLIEAALAAQSGGNQESRDNSQNSINSTMADTKIGEGGDVEKTPKKDRNRTDLKESQQLIMINTPGKTSDLSGSEKLNNSSPSTPSNTTKRTLAGGGTPSLRQEVSKLQDLMLEQEQAYVEQLAEKNDMIDALRKRISELESKEPRAELEDRLKARELEAAKQRKELNENTVSNKQLLIIMEEYEKAIASSVRRREDEKNEFEKIKEKIANERDTALQHLSNMEVAFNDIHLKYERCKSLIETLHSNEKQLKQTIEEQERVIEQQKQNYAKLKQHATEKVNEANQEIAAAHKSYQAEIAKMKAVSKKAELRVKSLEESLEQKKKEIKELTQICDELIGKVSGQ